MEAIGADLSFVNLGITFTHLPNSISVFGFRIAFYGVIIGLGMLAGMAVAFSDAKRRGQDPDLYLDFALYAIVFSIIGARLYYVAFEWDNYKNDLLQIFIFGQEVCPQALDPETSHAVAQKVDPEHFPVKTLAFSVP